MANPQDVDQIYAAYRATQVIEECSSEAEETSGRRTGVGVDFGALRRQSELILERQETFDELPSQEDSSDEEAGASAISSPDIVR